MQLIAQGAEAKIFDNGDSIIKVRLSKPYRIQEIDNKIIQTRLRKEVKILKKLEQLNINAPRFIKQEDNSLYIEKIHGRSAKDCINESNYEEILYQIGELVAQLHNAHIVHGDLTTMNFMVEEKDPSHNKIYVIDFGLSYVSRKDEDKAVDLYVFERALKCGHSENYIASFYEGYSLYGAASVLARLESVRLRGRKREENV